MSEIRCIVVEDEPLAAKVLHDYIAQVPFLVLDASFRDALAAGDYLRLHRTDLIFLDIHLPRLKGMAFLRTLSHPPAVIITTAYHQYAVEGFALNVTDYLLKPFDFDRFLTAVAKVKNTALPPPPVPAQTAAKDYLFVTVQKQKLRILFADLLYVESQREYVKIYTTKGDHVTKMSTHEIEALLPPQRFRRIHRSFIVSVEKIDAFTAGSVTINGISIPIGRGYKDVVEGL